MPSYTPISPDELFTLNEAERRHVLHVFKLCNNQRARTARILGIDRKTLYRRLLTYGVMVNDEPPRHAAAASRHPTAL